MQRIAPVERHAADELTGRLLDTVEQAMGSVPNILATMARSPAVLEAQLAASGALRTVRIGDALRSAVALAVSGANACAYSGAAHTVEAKAAGLDDPAVTAALRGESADERTAAALRFARLLIEKRGKVDDNDCADLRRAGFDDGAVVEIVAVAMFTTFTNYFNHVAQTEIDFPAVAMPPNDPS
ncbi:MAG: carboxymuconolactone decarboxylase family protein [Planctomycetota bacterium]